ncbi:MAG: F0F1 ATP synthase subunit B [Lachnospiraceae bacterium]|nr:F0F1 ATP synthase subunit B [Lachnospiraceae bacterium]
MEPRLFNLDFQLLSDSCLTLIAVFVLVLVASNLLFNPVREFMKKRREKIAQDLEQAKTSKEQAEAEKQEYLSKLGEIEKEAERILSEARKKAVENQKRIEEEARTEAANIIAQARREAELEKSKVADEVRQQMIEIASLMAGKVVSQSMTTQIQDSLVEETLKEMGESTWLS